jgi:hypothetical protein
MKASELIHKAELFSAELCAGLSKLDSHADLDDHARAVLEASSVDVNSMTVFARQRFPVVFCRYMAERYVIEPDEVTE